MLLSPQTLLERLPLRADSAALELGAGSRYYSVEVARCVSAGRLELFDIQLEMLEQCSVKCAAAGVRNVDFTVGDGVALPYKDSSFDLVYMVTVLGEVHAQSACLLEVARVLRRGGVLSISEHLPDPDFISLRSLRQQATSAGFALGRQFGSRWAYTANFRTQA